MTSPGDGPDEMPPAGPASAARPAAGAGSPAGQGSAATSAAGAGAPAGQCSPEPVRADTASGGPVLLARGLNWLGDAVISLPALRAARLGWQGELLTVARGAGAALYRLLPWAGEVAEDARGVMNRIGLARSLRRRAIPRAILFQNAFGAALTAWLAGVPERVGWNRHLRRMLLTLPVDPAPEDLAAHEVFYHLKLVREAGLPAPFSLPLLEPPAPCGTGAGPGADSAAPGPGQGTVTRERPRGFLLALAPGASYGGAKRWPAASFAAAAKLILEGRPGGSAVILGGRGEEAAAASETARLLAGGPPCRNLAGMTDLAECAAVLAGADLALTNDSGLMHLACALGTPAVTPFGPTDPVTTGPLGRRSAVLRAPVPCSPCLRRECHLKERICFAGVTPRMAAEAAERLLERTPAPFPDLGGRGAPAAFACSLPGGKPPAPLAAPPGVTLVFAIPAREAGDPRLEAPALAWDSPGWPDAPRLPFPQSPPGFPEPAASFGRRPVYIVPEAWPGRFFRDLARGLGADPAGSVWLAPDTEPLRAGRRAGGRTALWLGAGRGLPEGLLAGDFLPDICAPDFQRALDWTGQAT